MIRFAQVTVLATAIAAFAPVLRAQALEVGDKAPCVQLKDVQPDGTAVEQCIRTRAPGTVFVMLEFFSSTCSDCAANLPKLSRLAAEVSATTTTRMVGLDRDDGQMLTYVETHRDLIRFPVALDSGRDATRAYGVDATPTIFVLDQGNKIIYKLEDVFSDDQLALVKSLVLH